MIDVTVRGEKKQYQEGTTFLQIAKEYQQYYADDIVLVFVNGRLQELHKVVEKDCELLFETTAGHIGHKAYKRSISFMLVKALYDVGGDEQIDKVRIHYSVSKGYYCTMEGTRLLEQGFLDKVQQRMEQLVALDVPIIKKTMNTQDAIRLFGKHGMYDKEQLFEYRRVSTVNVYSMNEFEDYYYGYMVPSAGYLAYFTLHLYDQGFVIQMPDRDQPRVVPEFKPSNKLFQVLKTSTTWTDMLGIETVASLNHKITKENIFETVLVQEAMQEKRIAQIAEKITEKKGVKFIMIAGPSSSGKTTFSHRLSIQLQVNGLKPHPIAVDNYFVNREETPIDEEGNYNFECLEAIDTKLFNDHLARLLEGEEVICPIFNFKTGQKEYGNTPTKLGQKDVLVIEGIHCLNPKLTESLSDAHKFKIYISALTQLNIDEHNRIPTTDGRLLRRMVRDARTRGASAQRTIEMWQSVRRGEEENIFPYQEEADEMFNSALIYELAVLKQYVEPLLFGVDKKAPEYMEAKRLLKFLDYFIGIGSENVPTNSLLREFIGGGCFQL